MGARTRRGALRQVYSVVPGPTQESMTRTFRPICVRTCGVLECRIRRVESPGVSSIPGYSPSRLNSVASPRRRWPPQPTVAAGLGRWVAGVHRWSSRNRPWSACKSPWRMERTVPRPRESASAGCCRDGARNLSQPHVHRQAYSRVRTPRTRAGHRRDFVSTAETSEPDPPIDHPHIADDLGKPATPGTLPCRAFSCAITAGGDPA